MTLDEIEPGKECRVKKVTARGALGQRLMDLGYFPGVVIKIIRNAPLVDPVEMKVGTHHVSIRHEEARHVEVNVS